MQVLGSIVPIYKGLNSRHSKARGSDPGTGPGYCPCCKTADSVSPNNWSPSINEIRGTGQFPVRKCEFLRKARAGTHKQARDPAD